MNHAGGVIRLLRQRGNWVIADNETEKKLTEQQHQHELLRRDMEGNMKAMKAENREAIAKNESAIDRLVASNEKAIGDLRTDMEKTANSLTMRMIGMVTLLGGFITVLRFFT